MPHTQVILLEKVSKLGALGSLVKVKKGYARNFLIPFKKACRATPAAIQEFEARRAELERIAAEKLADAQQLGEKLSGADWIAYGCGGGDCGVRVRGVCLAIKSASIPLLSLRMDPIHKCSQIKLINKIEH